MKNSELIVGLDIGTTKIAAIVGRCNEHGKVEVLGMGRTESYGVVRGVVFNIDKTVQAIRDAIVQAESKSKTRIRSVYVGIAGQHIRSMQHRGTRTRPDGEIEITQADINAMIQDMKKLALPPGEEIIHVLPEEYIVDNEPNIKDPIGMCGNRLEANFHIITGQVTHVRNIYKCVRKAGLDVIGLILEPLASADAVLSTEEKEAGVALIDIGGGTTDIAIFQEGILRHTAVIPLGGNIITEDIKEGCTVMRSVAEMLKVDFGSAFAVEIPEETVSVPGLKGRESKEILKKNLASIIQARMEEILEHVLYEIRSSGYEKKLIGGIVATGGGSRLRHLPQLIEYITTKYARIGYPSEHIAGSPAEDVKHPMYATGIGLVIKGIHDTASQLNVPVAGEEAEVAGKKVKKKGLSLVDEIIRKTTHWLQDADSDM